MSIKTVLKPIIPLLFMISPIIVHAQVELVPDSVDVTQNKIIPDKVREAAIHALKHYPELVETSIEFRFTSNIAKSFMQAQPKFGSLFRNKKKRAYIIKMRPTLQLQNKQIPIEELPEEVLIGWLGHELGHVLDYKERTALSMVRFGIGYVFSGKYKTGAERRADMFAIGHFLGHNIYETKQFILEHTSIPVAYKEHIKKYYMSPEQVMEIIEEAEEEEEESN